MDWQRRGVLIMNTRCANTEALAEYERNVDREERRANAVSDYALELVCGELSICKFENFEDALPYVIEDREVVGTIHRALMAGHTHIVAQTIQQTVENLLAVRAEQMAISHVDSSCEKCFGRGCRKCDPPEPDYDD